MGTASSWRIPNGRPDERGRGPGSTGIPRDHGWKSGGDRPDGARGAAVRNAAALAGNRLRRVHDLRSPADLHAVGDAVPREGLRAEQRLARAAVRVPVVAGSV